MIQFKLHIPTLFGHASEDEKKKFCDRFNEYVREYAPDYEDSGEEIKLCEVWKYMQGTYSYSSTSKKFDMEELACNLANEVKAVIVGSVQ